MSQKSIEEKQEEGAKTEQEKVTTESKPEQEMAKEDDKETKGETEDAKVRISTNRIVRGA